MTFDGYFRYQCLSRNLEERRFRILILDMYTHHVLLFERERGVNLSREIKALNDASKEQFNRAKRHIREDMRKEIGKE